MILKVCEIFLYVIIILKKRKKNNNIQIHNKKYAKKSVNLQELKRTVDRIVQIKKFNI